MNTLIVLLPEAILLFTIVGLVLSEVGYFQESIRFISFTAAFGMLAAIIELWIMAAGFGHGGSGGPLFPSRWIYDSYMFDGVSVFFKALALLVGVFAVFAVQQSKEIKRDLLAESHILICLMVFSVCVAVSAVHLVVLYLAIQMISVSGFFLVSLAKRSAKSIEAGSKYFIFSAVSGVFFLLACLLLFSLSHSLEFQAIHEVFLKTQVAKTSLYVGLFFMLLSIAVQISAFPMYFWSPDVFQGAPTPLSGVVRSLQLIGGIAVLLRFLFSVFSQPILQKGQWSILGEIDWPAMLSWVAGLSLVIGALLAMRQKSTKRLLGSIVVSNSGVLLLGLIAMNQIGISALLYTLVVEVFSLIGAYLVLARIFDKIQSDSLDDFKKGVGIGSIDCICLVIFIGSLVGLPPLPGAIGRLALIGNLYSNGWHALSLIAVLTTAINCLSGFQIAFSLFQSAQTPGEEQVKQSESSMFQHMLLATLVMPIGILTVFSNGLLRWASHYLQVILW